MSEPRAAGLVERLRRGVKWLLFRLAARGDTGRYIDLRSRAMTLLAGLRIYQAAHLRFLAKVVGPGDVAVDVGAHFGIYTVALSALVGPRGRVLAFEPQALVFAALRRRRLPHANADLQRVALSAAAGRVTLRIPFVAGGVPEPALATLEAIAPPYLTDEIVTRTFDSYKESLHGLAFVKVDVEGHEIAFLDGARSVLRASRPLVQIEDNSGGRRLAGYLRGGALPGYALHVLVGGSLRRFDARQARRQINFYLVPEPAPDAGGRAAVGAIPRAGAGCGRAPDQRG